MVHKKHCRLSRPYPSELWCIRLRAVFFILDLYHYALRNFLHLLARSLSWGTWCNLVCIGKNAGQLFPILGGSTKKSMYTSIPPWLMIGRSSIFRNPDSATCQGHRPKIKRVNRMWMARAQKSSTLQKRAQVNMFKSWITCYWYCRLSFFLGLQWRL